MLELNKKLPDIKKHICFKRFVSILKCLKTDNLNLKLQLLTIHIKL